MAIKLPDDFKEFLRLFDKHQVEYLVVGGYAVAYHGYPRATADMDVWVRRQPPNAERIVTALKEFGFDLPELSTDLFLKAGQIIRMGLPPLRIEIWTTISGVEFDLCYANRIVEMIGRTRVNFMDLSNLKANKQAAGRHKDLDDLENLP